MTRNSDTRRQMIEATALRLFAEKGYADVSIRDIAQACQIGESALYRHMNSKEDLAVRVFRNSYIDLADQMMMASEPHDALSGKLGAFLSVLLNAYDDNPELVLFLLVHQHDVLARAITDEDITPVTLVHDALAAAMQDGEIPEQDLPLATAMAMGAALQPLTFLRYGRLAGPAIRHIDHIHSAICSILNLKG